MAQIAASAPPREIELDLLRGLAILAVVDFHSPIQILTFPFALIGLRSIGAVGVNVFFVLSGFLVGGLLVKEWITRGRVDSRRFLIRRGLKIWPQFYLFLVLNLISGHRSWQVLWPAFLNVQNYSALTGSRVPHLWSLAVEEHAYLLLTLLLALAWHFRMRLRGVLVILASLCLSAIALRMLSATHGFPYVDATHTRIEGILYGVILAILFHCAPEAFRRLQSLRLLWIAAIAIALAFLRFHRPGPVADAFSVDMSDLIGVASLLLVYRHQPNVVRSWPYRFIAWIGLYSYGIYLWSVSVINPAIALGNRLPHALARPLTALAVPIFGITLGMLMTRFVEFPTLRLRDRLFPRRIQSAVEDTPTETLALTTPTV